MELSLEFNKNITTASFFLIFCSLTTFLSLQIEASSLGGKQNIKNDLVLFALNDAKITLKKQSSSRVLVDDFEINLEGLSKFEIHFIHFIQKYINIWLLFQIN